MGIRKVKIEYTSNQVIGKNGVIYLKDTKIINGARYALFKCPRCGTDFETLISSVKNSGVASCGCLQKEIAKETCLKRETKLKPLVQEDYQVSIIEDLGMQLSKPTSKKKQRYALFECNECNTHFRAEVKGVRKNKVTKCPKCANNNRKLKPLNQEDYQAKLIKDLGIREKSIRWALFECPDCGVEFEASIRRKDAIRYCNPCAYKHMGKKIRVHKDSNTFRYKYYKSLQRKWKDKFEPSFKDYDSFDMWMTQNGDNKYLCRKDKMKPPHIGNIYTDDESDIGGYVSNMELEVLEYVKSLEVKTIHSHRKLLGNNRELDIVIPDNKLAIEFNGLYWHSELAGKHRLYHKDKTNDCSEKGYDLIHIFEHQWLDQQPIVKDIISKRLGKVSNKIYARKCELKEVETKEATKFLEDNHLQGYAGASIKLGLYYEEELVSIMTFGKARFNKNVEWELVRFANKLDTSVIGGASKLLKHFKKENQGSLISYCDLSVFSGKLYEELGFTLSHISEPNYWYFHIRDMVVYSRVKFQKHKLEKELEDFDDKLSEWENMKNNGYNRYFDCGNAVYILE